MEIRTINREEREHAVLEMAALRLTALSPNGATYAVEDTYFDYGQDWMWTTIIRHGFRECQVLDPSEWQAVVSCDSFSELEEVIDRIRNSRYFSDKEAEC